MSRYKKEVYIFILICAAFLFNIRERALIGIYNIQKKTAAEMIELSIENGSFLLKEKDGIIIYYTEPDSEYVDMIFRVAKTYVPMMVNDFGMELKSDITFIIYPSKEVFSSAMGFEFNKVPMGSYYGGKINLLSPPVWVNSDDETYIKDYFLENGPLVHELVHLFVDEKLNGKFDLWFTEGIALYYENKYTGYVWHETARDESVGISLEDLEKKFTSIDEVLSYRKSYEIIEYIVNTWDEEALQRIISKMEEGYSFRKAYTYVTSEVIEF